MYHLRRFVKSETKIKRNFFRFSGIGANQSHSHFPLTEPEHSGDILSAITPEPEKIPGKVSHTIMEFSTMKIIRIFSFLLLLGAALLAAAGKAEPVEVLRQDALAELRAFAAKWPQGNAARAARAILKQEEEAPDPNRWIGETIRFARTAFRENPPQTGNDEARRAAQLILDYPLRVEDTDPAAPAGFGKAWRETVNSVYQPVCDAMLDEILAARVKSGTRIWKVYNMGFIVKTPNHAWCHDVRSGDTVTRRFTPDQLAKLVKILDVMFISHNHLDHVGADLAREMVRAGKTVVRPTDDTVAELNGDPHLRNLYGRFGKTVEVDGLAVRAFPGYQNIPNQEVPCCVYAVTADGVTVTHNGDNQSMQPYELLEKAQVTPDVMLANSWSGFAPYLAAGKPKLAIIGHEHELKHKVRGRDPWVTVYKRIAEAGLPTPVSVIDCGESIIYPNK